MSLPVMRETKLRSGQRRERALPLIDVVVRDHVGGRRIV
jgi:hypothetical protein